MQKIGRMASTYAMIPLIEAITKNDEIEIVLLEADESGSMLETK